LQWPGWRKTKASLSWWSFPQDAQPVWSLRYVERPDVRSHLESGATTGVASRVGDKHGGRTA
jgi:hypothetical protein